MSQQVDATIFMTNLTSQEWKLERQLEDFFNGRKGTFTGKVTFAPATRLRWVYEERGRLQFGSESYSATRRYIFELRANRIHVGFDDGRPFYAIDGRQLPHATFGHDCIDDRYDGELSVDVGSWRTQWLVRGPRKDQLIRSLYF